VTYTRWQIEPLPEGEGSQRERERALAYDVLRRLLDGESPRLEHDGKGAPYLPDYPGLSVSISHCRTAVAVAVSTEGRVGVDVECRRRIGDGLMERVCTGEELEAVRAAEDPTMAFLQLWTRKEAVLKMRGTGIQGFGSMVDALAANDCTIKELDTHLPDVVASLAMGG
jgi:phosphopantetheinyl transferase